MIKQLLAAMLALSATLAFAAVDINKATQAELESVKGIGPAMSAKILDERKKGVFKDWQDTVDRVKGVGQGNAARFSSEGLTVNGAAFAAAPTKTSAPADARAADRSMTKANPMKSVAAENASKAKADKPVTATTAMAPASAAKK